MTQQFCPICGASVHENQRYPRYVCNSCALKACAPDGRRVVFSNASFSGGVVAHYLDSGELFGGDTCLIEGRICHAQEARFGGIVIQGAAGELEHFSAVLDQASSVPLDRNNSYIRSYPALLRYFATKKKLTAEDLICGAHMVYGWMPTILTLGDANAISPEDAATLVDRSRQQGDLSDQEIKALSTVTNNSLVGASKLLHFAAPESFAIWDSRIHRFVFGEESYQYRVNQVSRYRRYLDHLGKLQYSQRFPAFHETVNRRLGYCVSPLRALELVMFLSTAKTRRRPSPSPGV